MKKRVCVFIGSRANYSSIKAVMKKLKEADDLFAEGFYAEASKEYRNAQIAIEGSDLPDDIKGGLLGDIEENYNTANSIIEAARIHHSNAMNLIYEKRYEEADVERKRLEVLLQEMDGDAAHLEDDRRAWIEPLAAENLPARQDKMYAGPLYRGNRGDRSGKLAFQRADVIDVLNEAGCAEGLVPVKYLISD